MDETRARDRRIWLDSRGDGARPHEFYTQELLAPVRRYLFGGPGGGLSCAYRRVDPAVLGSWFPGAKTFVRCPGSPWVRHDLPVVVPAHPGIELFLSPFGVGVLSITLDLHPAPTEAGAHLSALELQECAYRLGQGHPRRSAILVYRHPREEWETRELSRHGSEPASPSRVVPTELAEVPPSPDPTSTFENRLGVAGGVVTLFELAGHLTAPVRRIQPPLEIPPSAGDDSYALYSVVRVSQDVEIERGAPASRLVSILAHVEEPLHPGSTDGTASGRVSSLNPRHAACFTPIGACHLVGDQGVPFDQQRVPLVADKYFIAYLLAWMQRAALQQQLLRALSARPEDGSEVSARVLHEHRRQLRHELLTFSLSADHEQISRRQAVNRCHVLACGALRLKSTAASLRRALRDLDALGQIEHANRSTAGLLAMNERLIELSREQGETARRMETSQTRLEWIEVLIFSVYVVELVHVVGEQFGFAHSYIGIAVLIAAATAAGLALALLRPWQHHRPGWIPVLGGLAVALFLAYLWGGWRLTDPRDDHGPRTADSTSAPRSAETSPQDSATPSIPGASTRPGSASP